MSVAPMRGMHLRLCAVLPLVALLAAGCSASTEDDEAAEAEELSNYVPPPAYAVGKRHSDLTDEVVANLRGIHARSTGRSTSFIKVGDSITYSTSFLRCLATTRTDGAHANLEDTRTFFEPASWARQSGASKVGWHTYSPTHGSPSPLDVEIDEMKPAFAVVMLGTNDNYVGVGPAYRRDLQALVTHLTSRGIVPILSTIPQRKLASANANVPRMNLVVRRVAADAKVPVMDFNLALSHLSGFGLSGDGSILMRRRRAHATSPRAVFALATTSATCSRSKRSTVCVPPSSTTPAPPAPRRATTSATTQTTRAAPLQSASAASAYCALLSSRSLATA